MLSKTEIDQAAGILAAARRDNAVIEEIPHGCRPTTLQEAYAVQDRMIELLGWPTAGWFCACTNTVIQEMLDLSEPYCARLLADFIYDSPALLRAGDFPPILLECEFGFKLGRDLPARQAPYTRAEVADAIASVHPTIEVVAGHIRDWPNQDVFSVIADNGTDGALVVGEGIADWRALDLTGARVQLSVNGKMVRQGSGANVLGDPVASFQWLANSRAGALGEGLKAGHIHNTGTATDICWITPGDEALAEFGSLGEVRLSLQG
jgi:2-keto-4-pentenoate hydratase